jgi:predicted DNA-binding transcriptional regulator YafY
MIIYMPSERVLEIMSFIDQSIRLHRARSPKEIAEILHISERQFYYYLECMKLFGAPIRYCRVRRRHIYTESGRFFVGFVKNPEDIP